MRSEPRRKNSMSWVDLKIWLREQKEILEKSYIDNLYYIKPISILIIKLYNSTKNLYYWLIIEPSKRVSISFSDLKIDEFDEKNQRIWRSLLKNCRIRELRQIPCERVLYIEVECKDKLRKLVIELLPRGSICVLDNQDKVELCNEYRIMKDRVIKPGIKYVPPPMVAKCHDNIISVLNELRLQLNDEITKVLIKETGLPPEIAESIVIQCNLKGFRISDLTNEHMLCINSVYRDLVIDINEYKPCIVYTDDNIPIGFYHRLLPKFTSGTYRIEFFKTFNEAINKFFEKEFEANLLISMSEKLRSEIESTKRALERIDKLLTDMRNELENLKTKLSIVEYMYADLERTHECVVNTIKSLGWSYVKNCNYVEEIYPNKGIYTIKINNVVLEFDVTKSFVELYTDLRKAIAGLEKSIARAEEERKKFETLLEALMKEMKLREKKISTRLSRFREWYETFIWYISSSGFLVIGGKDAAQNIKIIRKLLEPHDIVLHADIHGASTVVIKTRGKEADLDTIKEAAVIAACYSKAWKLKLMSIDVFWVYGSQISLSPPSGQYLPKGSYMVYGERNYLRNINLRLAIGIEVRDKVPRVVIGPEYVLDKRVVAYIVIIPGDEDPRSIAKDFIDYLRNEKCEELASLIDLNDITTKLPGKSKVVKKVLKGSCE